MRTAAHWMRRHATTRATAKQSRQTVRSATRAAVSAGNATFWAMPPGRRPVSGLAVRTARLPAATCGSGMKERPSKGLPLRGQSRDGRLLVKRRTAFPFHPPRKGFAADTCGVDGIANGSDFRLDGIRTGYSPQVKARFTMADLEVACSRLPLLWSTL